MSEVKTFAEVLTIANQLENNYGRKKYLLLGNGFSIDCKPKIFNYSALFDKADFSPDIKSIFNEFNTKDFEKIIKQLLDSSRVLKHYDNNIELSKKFNDEAENLKNKLVDAISKKHPSDQSEILETNLLNCLNFLSNFENIFTLNYDLLIYWSLMKRKDLKTEECIGKFKICDGFGKDKGSEDKILIWIDDYLKKQKIFYLHGALHFFDNGYNLQKIMWDKGSNTLISQIRENLEKNKFPLIVTEGNFEEKYKKIQHNAYLRACFKVFDKIQGSLFIHGHSLELESDGHILKSIRNNLDIKTVFISVYDPDNNFEKIKEKAQNLQRQGNNKLLDIYYYDSKTANVWR